MIIRSDLTEEIIGGAIEVHRALGPGLLESVYEECLAVELELRDLLPFSTRVVWWRFNVPRLKDGLKRIVNGFDSVSPCLRG